MGLADTTLAFRGRFRGCRHNGGMYDAADDSEGVGKEQAKL